MRRKEVLFAVIGGVVGAVLVMAVGLFSPLGAQNEVPDAEFGTITCSKLVVRYDGSRLATEIDPSFVKVQANERSVRLNAFGVRVLGEDGKGSAYVTVDEDGGVVRVEGKEDRMGSAKMAVGENGGRRKWRSVKMAVGKNGGFVGVGGNAGGGAEMITDEHGGHVSVYGKGSGEARAAMGVTEYGNGAVSTWDKNGYRLATLK